MGRFLALLQEPTHTIDRLLSQSWKTLDKTYTQSYTYDEHGRLTGKNNTLPNGYSANIKINYGDGLSRVTSVYTPVSNDYYNYLPGYDTDHTTGLVSAMSHNPRNGNSLSAFGYTYAYDKVGNITTAAQKVGSAVTLQRQSLRESNSIKTEPLDSAFAVLRLCFL